jgi:predicted PurR-regulated permease PerM
MTVLPPPEPESPKWSSTTKTVVGMAIVGILAALVIGFRSIIGPLILAFIVAFLLHPVSAWITRKTNISWRAAVNLIYRVLLLILIALITISGLAIIQQAQSLISFVDRFIQSLPQIVSDLSTRSFTIGPFRPNLSQLDLQSLTNQLLGIVQPAIGQAGTLLAKFAASAATTFGWALFLLIVSYFLLSEAGQLRANLVRIEIPGYHKDMQILLQKLAEIWDAFLRGQLLISLLVIVSYYFLLVILGTRLTIVIALMAGLARFVPWLGPLITWTVTAIVAYLQTSNHFNLEPLAYTLLVVGCCILLDQIFDNMVVPRVIGQALGLHPAGVLVAALIAARLLGLIGLVLAAPVLATMLLIGRYVGRKMFDLDPWPPQPEKQVEAQEVTWRRLRSSLEKIWSALRRYI